MSRLVPLVIFAVIAVLLYVGLGIDPREIPSPLIDKPVPAFDLPRLKDANQRITDKDLQGKVSLLNVWATWCVSCRAEHSQLVQLSRTGQVDIYGINWKDDRAAALAWLQTLGDPYVANAFDDVGRTAIDLGVYGAPETFIIDKKGVIRHKHAGPLNAEILSQTILPLVDKLNKEN